MLDLTVAMLREISILILLALQSEGLLVINSPEPGETVRGAVSIIGRSALPDFLSSEVSFSSTNDPTQTWFIIQTSEQPVLDGQLAVWDTVSITDGNYRLRLRTFLQNGSVQEVIVTEIHIVNDSMAVTETPNAISPVFSTHSAVPGPSATPVFLLATSTGSDVFIENIPTPLPANPASLSESAVVLFLQHGALFALVTLAAAGLYLYLRRS